MAIFFFFLFFLIKKKKNLFSIVPESSGIDFIRAGLFTSGYFTLLAGSGLAERSTYSQVPYASVAAQRTPGREPFYQTLYYYIKLIMYRFQINHPKLFRFSKKNPPFHLQHNFLWR